MPNTVDQNSLALIPDTSLTYQKIVLGGLRYWYNPKPSQNPSVMSMTKQETLEGANYTVWLGSDGNPFPQDREMVHTWDLMEQPFYALLEAKMRPGQTLAMVDEWGTSYTVLFASLTYGGYTAGGVIYQNVVATFWVVSSP